MDIGTRHTARRRRRRSRGDGGVALVEFAFVAPLLFALLFGIIEFGWAFFQYLDVRHGAREGARLAAVNFRPDDSTGSAQRADILAEACARMDSGEEILIRFTQVDGSDANSTVDDVGDEIQVEVSRDLQTLTGLYDWVLGGIDLDSTVTLRSERNQSWASTSTLEACPP